MSDLQRLDFHGDEISTCKNEETGKLYCIPREITERLGASWSGQHTKLTRSALFQRHTSRTDICTPGGTQEVLLLDIDYLPAWLGSISTEKVSESIREKLIAYQEECAQALRDYWTKGVAVNPRHAPTAAPQLSDPRSQLELIQLAHVLLDDLGGITERDRLMLQDQVRNVMQAGQRLLPAPHDGTPARAVHGFSLAERVAQLGYTLSRKQQAALFPSLGKKIADEYRSRFGTEPISEPRYVDGATRPVKWYAEEDATWIDPMIQGYLAQFPGLTRAAEDASPC